MKLLELPKSPYWGGNIHIGFRSDGTRRYSPRSSKVLRDPTRIGPNGERLDKEEARRVLNALQAIADEAMTQESDIVSKKRAEDMLESLLRAMGKTIQSRGPSWSDFAAETIDRHCIDLAPASARSYRSKLSGFNKWLAQHGKLSPDSRLSDFTVPDMQAFYDWWISEGGATTTANNALKIVGMVFDAGVVAEYVTRNPCRGVRRRDNISESKEPFTLSDLAKICRVLIDHPEEIEFADEWMLAIQFSIYTGARQSDCVKRSWRDFSDDCTIVRFVPQKKQRLHRIGKKDMTVTLHLPEHLAATLKAARGVSQDEAMTPNLAPISAGKTGLGARFQRILDLAGVEYTVKEAAGAKGAAQRSHTFHSFRHTLKTELREGGVSDASNHFVTGHDDAKVGERYIHEKSESVFRECRPVFDAIRDAIAG